MFRPRRRAAGVPTDERGGDVAVSGRGGVEFEPRDHPHLLDRVAGVPELVEDRHDVVGDRRVHDHVAGVGEVVESPERQGQVGQFVGVDRAAVVPCRLGEDRGRNRCDRRGETGAGQRRGQTVDRGETPIPEFGRRGQTGGDGAERRVGRGQIPGAEPIGSRRQVRQVRRSGGAGRVSLATVEVVGAVTLVVVESDGSTGAASSRPPQEASKRAAASRAMTSRWGTV